MMNGTFFEKNKIFLAVIIAAFIIGVFIFLSARSATELQEVWVLYKQSAAFQPFYKQTGLSLSRCRGLGQDWLQKPENLEGDYSCSRGCVVSLGGASIECEEGYIYDKNGLRTHGKILIPALDVRAE